MPDGPSQRPEDVRFISGVIIVSRQPGRAARFYRDVLGLPLAEERHGDSQPHWGCELGDTHLVELTQLGPGWLDHLKAHRAEGHDLVSRWSAQLRTAPETAPPDCWLRGSLNSH